MSMMFPDILTILIFIFIAILIAVTGFFLPKVTGAVVEILLSIAALIYLFVVFSFTEAMMLMSLSAATYGSFGMFLDRNKRKKGQQLKEELKELDYEIISQEKDHKRILADLLMTVFVSIGALLFLIFAPETYALLKLFASLALITILAQTVERLGNFFSTTLYWLPDTERLVIISIFQSRDFPMTDVKDVTRESAPDLLRLHPLFTFLSANQDYTHSFHAVLRLSFPGENIYFTPIHIARWQETLNEFADEHVEEVAKVLPLWHPKVLKRLFWKGYFAITVKGISAYTGLILILVWLEVSSYVMIGFVFLWLLFNLYISDRVLVAGTDAIEMKSGEIFRCAQQIFIKAGVPNTKLYMVDSPIYNGLATGMNIGRGTVMLTKATMELPLEAIEAIVAHEAIHIKKRDVLVNQIARMLFFGMIALIVYLFYDHIVLLADQPFILVPLLYLLMMSFPVFLSFVAQWTEVRADYFGAKLLVGGSAQMEGGLRELGNAQDQSLNKTFEYSMNDVKPMKNKASIERDNWFFRFIEFQFQAHPPLYFRIKSLTSKLSWKKTKREWLVARVKESLPDFFRKKVIV